MKLTILVRIITVIVTGTNASVQSHVDVAALHVDAKREGVKAGWASYTSMKVFTINTTPIGSVSH